jgi:hypothetical protein
MDIAGVHTLLETAHEAATAVDIERVTLTKATPEQRLQLVYLPGAAHPVPVRVPGDHPSAGVPPGGSLSLGWAAVTRMGRCHSDGLDQHPLELLVLE